MGSAYKVVAWDHVLVTPALEYEELTDKLSLP